MVFLYCLEVKYLHNQGIVWPQVLSSILANGINVLANYIFVSVLDMGVPGSALANTISQFIQAIVLFLYIMVRKLYRETWEGWSLQCLQDWEAFLSLAIPGMLMICIEWWAYEIGSFLIGLLSVAELSAQSIIYEVSTIAYMVSANLPSLLALEARGKRAKEPLSPLFLINFPSLAPIDCPWRPLTRGLRAEKFLQTI
ncbi:multidrug and toxin extrusion protein 2-like, partial [Gracilinanus agilis]|uniref:multidrug and toxin extrusion protein 2-like n=1 Tax=Gracilinanus agilis TaxID=191870 RepID=UPI001CFDF8BC